MQSVVLLARQTESRHDMISWHGQSDMIVEGGGGTRKTTNNNFGSEDKLLGAGRSYKEIFLIRVNIWFS